MTSKWLFDSIGMAENINDNDLNFHVLIPAYVCMYDITDSSLSCLIQLFTRQKNY
jgi:hypothetical protein